MKDPSQRLNLKGIRDHVWVTRYRSKEKKLLQIFDPFKHLEPGLRKQYAEVSQRLKEYKQAHPTSAARAPAMDPPSKGRPVNKLHGFPSGSVKTIKGPSSSGIPKEPSTSSSAASNKPNTELAHSQKPHF